MKDNKGDCSFYCLEEILMDIICVELEEKYIAYAEPREECIAFSVYIKSGDFSGRGNLLYS